ncbi:MAG: MarR family transcriptional regulator [Bacteroidetes bacterium]|nr:MarR family transcriptional regulator [Bacteroidota bacterium]
MSKPDKSDLAGKMADLTFSLLEQCQVKQERIAATLGLTVSEFKLLRSLRQEGVVAAGELARRVELSSSRLTRILDGMVEKGLVTREAAQDDRRVIEVSLTEGGKRIQQTLNEKYVATHQDILDLLPPGGGESVVVALEKLGEAMQEWVKLEPEPEASHHNHSVT